MRGRVTENKAIAAREEYRHRAENGEQDVRVMVATNMPARRWENSTVEIHRNGCRVDVAYSADMSLVDVELVDVDRGDWGYAAVFAYLCYRLGNYALDETRDELLQGVGPM